MKSWIVSGSLAAALLLGQPAEAQYADPGRVIGGGLLGAGAGAALGAIAGGGRGAATGAMIGGALGAVGSTMAPPAYAYGPRYYGYRPYYRRHVGYGRCGPGGHWVSGHRNRWGEWRPGHCSPNY